ncbi:MAG: hypothetical protein QOF89_2529 [Acidobacteriota bacterium]|jgi:hypothetical protein|nr:hypothetical protein [Acidobacteriota bacterium]
MLTATITVSLNSGALQYQSSDDSIVSVSGTGAGTRLRLHPTLDDPNIELTFAPGAGIDSLNSLTTPASAFGGSPILGDGNGNVVVTCNSIPLFEDWAFSTELGYTVDAILLKHDPTIVFNPPSGGALDQLEEAPVAAEPVMV